MRADPIPRSLPWLPTALACAAAALLAPAAHAAVLFDNGPAVINGLSVQPPANGRTGFAIQTLLGHRIADDFTVGATGWTVTDIDLFPYINNGASFLIQSVSWSIVAGANPNSGSFVAGGSVVPTSGGLVGYRVGSTSLGNQTRPIWRVQTDIADVTLAPGRYWLTWSMTSPDSSNGPWQPGTADGRDGNLWQSFSGAAYVTAADPFSGQQSDVPFVLYGVTAVPEAPTAVLLACGLAAVAARRVRARKTAA